MGGEHLEQILLILHRSNFYNFLLSLLNIKAFYMSSKATKTIFLFALLITGLIGFPVQSSAQTLPVGGFREKQVRIQQLFNDSLSISFSNRPIWMNTYEQYFEGHEFEDSWWNRPYYYLSERVLYDFIKVGVYEPVFALTNNSKFPYNGGGNNGAAWYGRGLITEFRAGFFATSDYFTVTFRPHLIYTQNKQFKVPRFVPRDEEGNVLYGHEELQFRIDAPFRFGPDSYSTFDLAQSSVRLHYKPIEIGLSNAPLWWGPGVQNALMLSNNAPGLQHVFFGTRWPLQLPLNIGQVEFKLIGAWPEDSDYFRYTEATDQRRFMSGLNFIFTPSFAPHLYLGFSRVIHTYIDENGLAFEDFIAPLKLGGNRNPAGVAQNQIISVYFRWLFPGGNAEVYGEYYREDNWGSFRDLLMEPDHDRAYTVGFQKIIPSDRIVDFVKVNLEFSSLVPNATDIVRFQTYYYTHGAVRQGHTNEGQILGAAIGTGSASQYLGTEAYFEDGMIGLFVQRVADNDYFHYEYNYRYIFPIPTDSRDYFNHQIDVNIGLNAKYKISDFLLGGRIIWSKAYNYGRYELGDRSGPDEVMPGEDLINWQVGFSVRYLF